MADLKATADDVRHAYRLLLGREPDPEGYRHYRELIEAQAVSTLDLSQFFLDSAEFRQKQHARIKQDTGTRPPDGVVSLTSMACTQRQIESPTFRYWATQLRERSGILHRKLWEWCFITQALYERGMLHGESRGLGFAVGTEPLSALFANSGCNILASDLDLSSADRAGWVTTNQHASSLAQLNRRGICPDQQFGTRVSFREIDMRAIPEDMYGFDFLWSSCALEHLGSLQHGLDFVLDAMKCLRPGGVAVHTTEFNCDSDVETIETGDSVVYRKSDLQRLGCLLDERGHSIESFNFDLGDSEADRYVDEPPYKGKTHLKLRIGPYVSTSFGIIIRKSAD